MLDAKTIIADAEHETGIADSDPTVGKNLARLVAALAAEGGLSAQGTELTRRQLATGEMRKIHRGLGIETPDAVAQAVGDWHRQIPKNARGKNEYTVEHWGLNSAELAEQFTDYRRRFTIPSEADGLARIAA